LREENCFQSPDFECFNFLSILLPYILLDYNDWFPVSDPQPIDDINITTHDTSSLLVNCSVFKAFQQYLFEVSTFYLKDTLVQVEYDSWHRIH
jgi:hypothetical protein